MASVTGVEWVEMHKLAERVELEELKKCGILHGDVEEMMKVQPYTLKMDKSSVSHAIGQPVC